MSLMLRRRMTQLVSVKRLSPLAGSPPTRGAPTVIATTIDCVPFYPATLQFLQRTKYEGPQQPFETFTEFALQPEDELVDSDGLQWPVFFVAPWKRRGVTIYHAGLKKMFRG